MFTLKNLQLAALAICTSFALAACAWQETKTTETTSTSVQPAGATSPTTVQSESKTTIKDTGPVPESKKMY